MYSQTLYMGSKLWELEPEAGDLDSCPRFLELTSAHFALIYRVSAVNIELVLARWEALFLGQLFTWPMVTLILLCS